MPVEHACIAFQGVILVEDKPTPPKLLPVIQKLVQNATRHDSKASYQYENNMYSTQVEHEILYLVVTSGKPDPGASPTAPTLMAYTFIQDMQNKFKSAITGNPNSYPQPSDLTPFRCQAFASTIQNLVKTYTENPNHNNKMIKLKSDIEVVKTQMLENIDAIVKRGGDIERLCDKTDMLQEQAVTFNRRATTLRKKMLMRNIKLAIAIVVAIGVLAFIISLAACGIDYHKCKSSDAPATAVPLTLVPGETWAPYTLGPGETWAPTTASPPSPQPPTPVPPTPQPPTPQPPTPQPPTPQPPTPQPPTPVPPTPMPPTPQPTTSAPTTAAPPTPAPT
jgi:vesicle-associated membrane protein 7